MVRHLGTAFPAMAGPGSPVAPVHPFRVAGHVGSRTDISILESDPADTGRLRDGLCVARPVCRCPERPNYIPNSFDLTIHPSRKKRERATIR